jgi:hypothetical protein
VHHVQVGIGARLQPGRRLRRGGGARLDLRDPRPAHRDEQPVVHSLAEAHRDEVRRARLRAERIEDVEKFSMVIEPRARDGVLPVEVVAVEGHQRVAGAIDRVRDIGRSPQSMPAGVEVTRPRPLTPTVRRATASLDGPVESLPGDVV